eukprot:4864495-Pleurochrysis_carterae.AAC.1
MCELTYGGSRAKPSATTTNSVPPPAAAAPSEEDLCTRRRPAAPSVWFLAGAATDEVVAADGSAEPEVALAELMEFQGGSDELTDSASMQTFLKQQIGERAANVLSVLRLWEAFSLCCSLYCVGGRQH